MIFQHLLPRARAWSLTISKQLREFFEGLTVSLIVDIREFLEEIWTDIDPQETRELSTWETQFGLPATALTEQERRDRLEAAWKVTGGQSPRYIQDTLQNSGFDVYVHEWWVPGSEPAPGVKACVTPRDPNTIPIQPLVNIILISTPDLIVLAGEAGMEAGEALAEAGNYLSFKEDRKQYDLPSDPAEYPYFLYIGGETFGTLANVDATRKDEFEALCLKICPCHLWLGIMVNFV